jgi:hypothetical protein
VGTKETQKKHNITIGYYRQATIRIIPIINHFSATFYLMNFLLQVIIVADDSFVNIHDTKKDFAKVGRFDCNKALIQTQSSNS